MAALAHLASLNLRGNRIGDEGARALSTSPFLANLTSLDLAGNRNIGDAGALALADALDAGALLFDRFGEVLQEH